MNWIKTISQWVIIVLLMSFMMTMGFGTLRNQFTPYYQQVNNVMP